MPSQELTNFVTEINQIMKKLFASAFIVGIAISSCQSDVIDPAETRRWVANSLRRLPPTPLREGKKYPYIDTW